MDKRGFFSGSKNAQMGISFGWLFAIIVGVVILFLTIYGVSKFINTSETQQQSVASKDLSNLLNPLETSFESATSSFIERDVETRIHNRCYLSGNFGEQGLKVSEESFNGWSDSGLESVSEARYVFSDKIVEGNVFYLFSKPFEFPYKTADLIYLTSGRDNYCFSNPPEDVKNPPEDVKDELSGLGQSNVIVGCEDADGSFTKVCFGSSENKCDVSVDYDGGSGKVVKEGEEFYFYSDALMYAAVFSDKDIYRCQTKRLFKRAESLASLYVKKSSFIRGDLCGSSLTSDLNMFNSRLNAILDNSGREDSVVKSFEFSGMSDLVKRIERNNDNSFCRLW